MKKYTLHIALLLAILVVGSCQSFKDGLEADKIAYLSVTIDFKSKIDGIAIPDGAKVTLQNFKENIRVEAEVKNSQAVATNLMPGAYNIVIEERAVSLEGDTYLMKGAKINHPIVANNELISITLDGLQVSPLVFKEIYYCGSRNLKGSSYFRDQFYEIYNNSATLIYLDGLYFADLYPNATETPPSWSSEYVYASRVWMFPGTGTDYPLQPGESCVISQLAINHQLDLYNPNSPINCFSSEFEFTMNNPNFPNQPAVDMVHVYYDKSAAKGSQVQYLTTVFGSAYVIFKPTAGDVWDPVNNLDQRSADPDKPKSNTHYAKIPLKYVIDLVEAGNNEVMAGVGKRIPSMLDAGMTWVGDTYIGKGVARIKIGENPDGTPILQDTNNSTNDFERGVTPMFRRYGSKMPSWNHTLR